jgi:hypothetical protein
MNSCVLFIPIAVTLIWRLELTYIEETLIFIRLIFVENILLYMHSLSTFVLLLWYLAIYTLSGSLISHLVTTGPFASIWRSWIGLESLKFFILFY